VNKFSFIVSFVTYEVHFTSQRHPITTAWWL